MNRSLTSLLIVLSALFLPIACRAGGKWDKDIAEFEARDKTNPPPANPILFVGSSSFRLWTNLNEAFPNSKVINRGFGGSQLPDLIDYCDRLILRYKPSKIFIYAGDNDIAAGRTPDQVVGDFKTLVAKIRKDLPSIPIYFVSIKPSPSRWHLASKARSANSQISDVCEKSYRVTYIDVFTPMLDEMEKPDVRIFGPDKLHMNKKGYDIWKKILTPYVTKELSMLRFSRKQG